MSRSLPLGFDALERGVSLAPNVDVTWSDRYLGRPTLRASVSADDGLATNHAALAVKGSELLQLKSSGTAIQFQRRNATTLALIAAWSPLATSGVAGYPVGLTQSVASGSVFAIWCNSTTVVQYRRSTDGGVTWLAAATLHTAGAGNTVYSILTSWNGVVAVEERRPGSPALLKIYQWNGSTWVLALTYDTGGTAVWGGGIDTEGGTFLVFALDVPQTTTDGTVTIRYTRMYDLDAGVLRGNLQQGSEGGVRWREPRPVHLTSAGKHLLATVVIPRGSGDASDRVSLFPWSTTQVGSMQPVGPPRAVYAVEDTEAAAVVYGASALYVQAGSFVQRLLEGTSTGTASVSAIELAYEPEDEHLDVAGVGTLQGQALQLRCRLGLSGTYVDMGIFWIGPRVPAGRQGFGLSAYGLWGVLRRELQQQSCELLETNGDPLTPGKILELVFRGLGYTYTEAAGLSGSLHPAVANRLTWAMSYGQDYATLVRAVLRWVGCEIVPGVAADGITPTVRVMRPGSRFGPTPAVFVDLGASGDHPMLECVSADPETVTDVTIFPGGWDHQVTLAEPVDRQLVFNVSEAAGLTQSIEPATRALARALAGADAGTVRCRPALEIELWDTVSITDGPAGLSAARRLVRSVAVAAGRGRWEMELLLGLE